MSKTMPRKRTTPDKTTYSGRVAIRVRTLRESKNMSVQEVVAALEEVGITVSEPAWYTYENGTRTMPPDLYPHVAAVFGLKLVDFLPAR